MRRSAGSARHLAGSQHVAEGAFANTREAKFEIGERTGKLAGAGTATYVDLKLGGKANLQDYLVGSGGDLLKDKIVVVFPEMAGAHAG